MLVLLHIFALAIIAAAAEGPCDILGAAGNPCVAAHSTVRALYGAYEGPLYNVTQNVIIHTHHAPRTTHHAPRIGGKTKQRKHPTHHLYPLNAR